MEGSDLARKRSKDPEYHPCVHEYAGRRVGTMTSVVITEPYGDVQCSLAFLTELNNKRCGSTFVEYLDSTNCTQIHRREGHTSCIEPW